MKRTAYLIVASLFAGLLFAGCAAPAEPDEEEDMSEPGLHPQTTFIRTTTYYAEAAHINEIGYCVWQICWSPKGTTCYGSKSSYYTVETETSCY